MRNQGHYDRAASRYVTRREEAEISLLSRWFEEEPQEPSETPEAMPAPRMRDFGPLWAKCPNGRPCGERERCACQPARAWAIYHARLVVIDLYSGDA
jgi:hypothetical protein